MGVEDKDWKMWQKNWDENWEKNRKKMIKCRQHREKYGQQSRVEGYMTTRQDMREEKNFMGGEGLVSLCGWFFEQFTGPWLLTLEAKVPTHPMFLWLYPHVPWQDGCCLQREKSIPQEQENKKYIPMLKICPELPIDCFYTVTVLWVFKAQNLTAFSISILARTLVKMFKLVFFFFLPIN